MWPIKHIVIFFLLLLTSVPHGVPIVASEDSLVNEPSSPILVEVWSPDTRSSNITSLDIFPVGREFNVLVNLTGAGPVNGFDITLNYNITAGPNPISAVKTGSELSGGLFDPDNPPSGCSILVAKHEVNFPAGRIRLAAVVQGGCSVAGTGTLFTLRFRVIRIGATSIDILRTNQGGTKAAFIIGSGPVFPEIPFQPVDAYFRNKPGIPPAAEFSFNPSTPVKGDTVQFDGSHSYDPDNTSAADNGIARYKWEWGDHTDPDEGGLQNHLFEFLFQTPAAGDFSVKLVVWDTNDNLPGRLVIVVHVDRGIQLHLSLNWSGYAVVGAQGSVTEVTGSWVVPGIVGSCPATTQYASFWIGIDGLTSPTVEQIGTSSACVNGSPVYFAWYELYPRPAITIRTMKIVPGDVIAAKVEFSGGKFILSISDITTGESFSRTATVRDAQRSSAEWIAEAPSSREGILELANFGAVEFGPEHTGAVGTGLATIAGITGPIRSFGSFAVQITMVSGANIKAQPTPLSMDGTSFTVQWVSPGP